MNLGTLKEITNLRDIWSHEALNCTPLLIDVFDSYERIYRKILDNIYPAKNSTGFPERNLSVNFSKAYESVALHNNQEAFTWFELQFGESNNLHVDAVVINNTTKEMFVIEAKRYSNPTPKMREIGEDIDRVFLLIDELKRENDSKTVRIRIDEFEHIYGVILADVWSETPLKTDILQTYKDNSFLEKYKDEIRHTNDVKGVEYYIQSFSDIDYVKKYNLVSFVWKLR